VYFINKNLKFAKTKTKVMNKMYLAPLNYDRYFKKVFSEEKIAKRFLEDFFEVEITEFEVLSTKHKITDSSSTVEFDFRCKIDNNYVIIDMQQWYKSDIVHRFYMYHSMNSVLQLENMPDKSIKLPENKYREIKNYKNLLPVITLIWLADDNMGFSEDFVSYTMTSESLLNFVRDKNIWKEEKVLEIITERNKQLKIVDNKTKQLDFLQKNKLIYAFQKNIAANPKFSKYKSWFELAQKTKDKLNAKGWFDEYLKDDIFVEIIKRLNTETFDQKDWEFVEDYEKFEQQVKLYEKDILDDGIDIGKEIGKVEGIEIGKVVGIEIGKVEGIEIGVEKQQFKTIENCLKKRMKNEEIAELLDLTIEKVIEIIKLIEKEK